MVVDSFGEAERPADGALFEFGTDNGVVVSHR